MPVISRFNGIVIKMYFQQVEHNPPHIHAFYGEKVAAISIQSGEVLDGEIPLNEMNQVKEWVILHKKELLDIWNTQVFKKIEPLS